jgi:GTP-binding protein
MPCSRGSRVPRSRSRDRPCVVVINKWDLARATETATQEWAEYFDVRMPGLTFAPKVFTTALTGKHVTSALDLALMTYKQSVSRIPTSQINSILEAAIQLRRPSKSGTRIPRIYYGTQVDIHPPKIVVFVNDPKIFRTDYARYLINRFREAGVFDEVPLEIIFRGRDRKDAKERFADRDAAKAEARAAAAAGGDGLQQREGDFTVETQKRGPRGGPSKKKQPEKRHGRRQGRRFKA